MNVKQLNFLRDGVTKLPPGFRFQPTDEEIVFQYLKCKVFSLPLPASIIPELNICKFDPWDLPGELEEERYFFSSKEAKYKNGNRINRATASGYWKATGLDKQIISRRYKIAGMRKTLVFHMGKPPHGSRTDWIMHEYRLVLVTSPNKDCNHSSPLANNPKIQNYLKHHMEKWVLCHVFLKKRFSEKSSENEPKFFGFMRENDGRLATISSPSFSSDSSSKSSITEDSSSGSEDQALEESSRYNNFVI